MPKSVSKAKHTIQ